MKHRFSIGLRIVLIPLAAGLAFAQTHVAPAHPASPQTGQPTAPPNLRQIFAGPFGSRLAAADTTTVSITPGGIVPIYSTATTIQAGEWVSIYGNNLAPSIVVWNGQLPFATMLGGTSVTIDGNPAYLSFVAPTQINVQAPDDMNTGTVNVVVTTSTGSATSTVTLGQFGPSFAIEGGKYVAGIIFRTDGSGAVSYPGGTYDIIGPNGTSWGGGVPNKAVKAGDVIEIFGVGFGPTNPPVPSGQIVTTNGIVPASSNLQILIGGTSVPLAFAGITEAGLFQFNLTLPTGLGTGDVSIVGMVGGVQTPPEVFIPLQ